jgi:uncharacterized protein YciI
VSEKYVVLYEAVDDFLPKAQANFEEHQAWYMQFAERGELLMVGPYADGGGDAMSIFTTREAAEAFVAGDPFVRNGVVANYRIREWREALIPGPD